MIKQMTINDHSLTPKYTYETFTNPRSGGAGAVLCPIGGAIARTQGAHQQIVYAYGQRTGSVLAIYNINGFIKVEGLFGQ